MSTDKKEESMNMNFKNYRLPEGITHAPKNGTRHCERRSATPPKTLPPSNITYPKQDAEGLKNL